MATGAHSRRSREYPAKVAAFAWHGLMGAVQWKARCKMIEILCHDRGQVEEQRQKSHCTKQPTDPRSYQLREADWPLSLHGGWSDHVSYPLIALPLPSLNGSFSYLLAQSLQQGTLHAPYRTFAPSKDSVSWHLSQLRPKFVSWTSSSQWHA
jgi:hypothetical protein